MTARRSRQAALLAAMIIATSTPPAAAHTSLASSTPASGAILAKAPTELRLSFIEPTRVTRLVLIAAGAKETRLKAPRGEATHVSLALPPLGDGRYEVVWNAVSKDGHPVEGRLIFVVRTLPRP